MASKPAKQTLLVPIDFSPYSKTALLKACELADCLKLSIVVLHVVHDPSQLPGYYVKMTKKKHLIRIEDVAKEMFEEFMAMILKDNPELNCLKKSKSILVTGLPVSRILEVAKRVNASMIVMGSQGRTGLEHIMLGSKAEQVVHLSPIPVTIVKI
ncbi:MAG: universal stress protein [Gammaproteobacteria bacterium]|jgi:nucleotide-binding universal stress UspA family protein|nr:universal stress protein [Gammaproteobacteria bacterium]MBT3721820.1 universal stress protein [Gammaproteobacteria bacterium]MBT4078339.1 universal stress protein [Gammaproteobacteria bacterium]MBT4196100.1 universal stress protein [Gammaproteobacteria bacterium]MBT4451784.1 universal stress protein [Gammaproteobacteria bacterium]